MCIRGLAWGSPPVFHCTTFFVLYFYTKLRGEKIPGGSPVIFFARCSRDKITGHSLGTFSPPLNDIRPGFCPRFSSTHYTSETILLRLPSTLSVCSC